jgi:hypothetical protein
VLTRHCFPALLAALLLAAPAEARQDTAADTTAVLRAALDAFSTVNGPFIEVVVDVPCAQAEDWGPFGPMRVEPCRSPATDAAVEPYASRHRAVMIDREPAPPTPNCPWNALDGHGGGLRLAVVGFAARGETYLVAVFVTCKSDDPIIGGFFNLRIFEVSRKEEVWRAQQLSSLIT